MSAVAAAARQHQWQAVALGSVLTLHYGKPLPATGRKPDGNVPVYGANGVKDHADVSLCNGPALIIGRKGSAGEITRVDGSFWPLDVTYYTSHDSERLDFDYMAYALSMLNLQSLARGVKPGINRNDVYALEIPLPPLEEQKRIVVVLDQAFAALDCARVNAEANLADAQELFGAALSGLSRSGSPSGRQPLRLGSIVTRLTNGYVGPIKNVYVDVGVPYLLARHVRDNTLNFDGKTYISPAFNEKHKKSKLKAGDVLLVQSGHIGHSAVVPQEHEGHNCHAMIVITPIASIVSGAYLSLMFNTPRMRARFEEIRSGSTVPHLTCKMVKELTFDIPPRPVQDRIVAQAADLRHRTQVAMSQYRSKLSDLAVLRQSLLQKAFAGELA